MRQRETFDRVADLYGEVRRGYSDSLIEDAAAYAGLKDGDAILDVGCGAGQATESFAGRGFRVVALDPGGELIRVARERLSGVAGVSFVVSQFETWDAPAAAFKLVISAQAWHWIPPAQSFPKAAHVLMPQGVLAVFGHVPMRPPEPLSADFERIHRMHIGQWPPPPEGAYLPDGPFAAMFAASGLFAPVVHKSYAWTWPITSETFVRYMLTRSDTRQLPEGVRDMLLADLKTAIDSHGGLFHWPFETHLYMARRDLERT